MTALPRLIGLIGRKGAGKDTAAEVLLSHGYANVKFAGALKDMVRNLLLYQGVAPELAERMVEGDLKETPSQYLDGRTPRYAMQTIGTEWGRDLIGKDFWAKVTMALAEKYLEAGKKVVITDVRFPNELVEIHALGGVSIGISADWISATEGEHESEALIDDLIAGLSPSNRIINRRLPPDLLQQGIQDFQARFLHLLDVYHTTD